MFRTVIAICYDYERESFLMTWNWHYVIECLHDRITSFILMSQLDVSWITLHVCCKKDECSYDKLFENIQMNRSYNALSKIG